MKNQTGWCHWYVFFSNRKKTYPKRVFVCLDIGCLPQSAALGEGGRHITSWIKSKVRGKERVNGHASKIKPWRNYEIERTSVVVVCTIRGEMCWCDDFLMGWIHLLILKFVVVIYQSDYSVSSAKMFEKSAPPQSVGVIQKERESVSIPSLPASLHASPPSDVPLPHPKLYLKLSSHEYARNYKYGDFHQQTCNGVRLLVFELVHKWPVHLPLDDQYTYHLINMY